MLKQTIIREFSNMGHRTLGRNFAGFQNNDAPARYVLQPRGCLRIALREGDVLQVGSGALPDPIALAVFGKGGVRIEAQLGLPPVRLLAFADFDHAELTGWLQGNGATIGTALPVTWIEALAEPLILRAPQACDLVLVLPLSHDHLVSGKTVDAVEVSVKRAGPGHTLPDPLGDVRDEFTVDRATAQAYELRKGETLQIIDVMGQQCSDFQAFRMAGLDAGVESMIDGTTTRSMVRRAFPGPGLFDKFFDGAMAPLLQVMQDTCGRHDTFGLACTARGYEERGYPGHVNCSDNISRALAPYGVVARAGWPAINFFWNTWIDGHHHLQTAESWSRPGDYIAMKALDDLVCVTTACPDDIDPINGWNPTDVHVRIYRPETKITRAIAYRKKENAPMQISQPSAFHPRLAPLTDHFAPARDLWAPVSFPSFGTQGEYWACREAATLQDMSGLRKFDVIGPDAQRLLQLAMTRDIAKLAVWRGTYALMCDESGEVIDDGTLFRLSDHLFRWCCGSEESGTWLTELAAMHGLQVRIHDLQGALPNLALQGPKSRDILSKVLFTQPHVPNLDQLKWFGATVGRLGDRDGVPFMLTRSGYTGELGYELFCARDGALPIWDALMDAGAELGLKPMGSAALDIIRIEAGLAAAGAEFVAGADAFEAGLGFAVDLKKAEFVGHAALRRNAEAQRRKLVGLHFQSNDVPLAGAPVFKGERQIGEVTSATLSPMLGHAIAMARLSVEHADSGTEVEVGLLDGRMKRLDATVATLPFFDPTRERARA
ncbi:aminomethyltransferase family protein [uncultured Tateyamaria sp.]|uniref:DUF1989 domain-containing protein n=1 Tax=uncultured Tateyamaria sp. TaxID=455651 RepID=UPI00260D48C4|nr:aminomethyltransferase family protein [uncultured Tateyamaria sp.]